MEQQTEKLCKNCKYFLQYYVIIHNRLKETVSGHCYKHNFSFSKMQKRIIDKVPCECWGSCGDRQEELKQSVRKEITEIHSMLDKICIMLQPFEE